MSKKKKIIIGAVAAAVVIIAVVLIIIFAGKTSDKGKIYVQSVKSLMGQDAFSNRFSGIVETQKTEKIELDLSREIAEIYVSEGSKVKAGQALFSYNTDSLRLDIEQMQIEIEKCNTTIANNNEEITQLRNIMNTLPAADQLEYSAQIQMLQADIAQAQYDIKTKEANINAKKNAIDKSTVTATMAGTVQKINDENAIRNAEPGTTNVFMTVTAEGDFRIKGSVGEQNIFEIVTGELVIVRSRVNPDQIWTGTITSVNTQGEEENPNDMYYGYDGGESSTKYSFYVNLDSTEDLMLGQHVTIEVDHGQNKSKDGVWLSSGYIVYTEKEEPVIWAAKKDGAKLEQRKVTLGLYDEELDLFEIKEGIGKDEYVAWPSSDCKVGAATTTVITSDEPEIYEEDFGYEGDYGMDTFDGAGFDDTITGDYSEIVPEGETIPETDGKE